MNTEYDNIILGDIRVDSEVVKSVAIKAATEVQGIHELKTNRMGNVLGMLTGRNVSVGARLEFRDNAEVRIKLKLLIEYGMNITDVASLVQENVKRAVEYMTGLNVTKVTVNIVGMHIKK